MAMMIVNMTTSITDYLCNAKKEKVGWRQNLHNNFIRSKKLGGDITAHLMEYYHYYSHQNSSPQPFA